MDGFGIATFRKGRPQPVRPAHPKHEQNSRTLFVDGTGFEPVSLPQRASAVFHPVNTNRPEKSAHASQRRRSIST